MATELEIKLSVSEAAQAQALEWLSSRPEVRVGKNKSLINRYFDTPNADLNRAKAALRVRKAGDDYIQTLKTRGEFVDGAHRREEWEWPVFGPELDLSLLEGTPLNSELDLRSLEVVFETNFQRQVLWLEEGQSVIEIAVDSGIVAGKDARWPLHEVEFELKSGEGGKLVAWALELAREVPVFLNLVSKAEQGYLIAGLYCPEIVRKSEPITVTEFLQALGACWLLDKPFPSDQLDLTQVQRAAVTAGCGELYECVIAELAKGAAVREFSEGSTQLGVLQLQLAAAGQ
ncbi:CYTH domain-containing protein [Marinobacter adhaerens]|jgi:triphosphatase|uniref:CYTH domain-containing protein n=1 Tax=Marinobacter adhaerens TaxID=1033846 RepID=UPI001E3CED20|nr:CYTH domain-containing protein [Marinobacter adhaerens]MCD1649501.1 CYTH domain-containing protein [Marinobacter adhaerens]